MGALAAPFLARLFTGTSCPRTSGRRSTAELGGPGDQQINSIVLGGPGFVAVIEETVDGDTDAV